MTDDMPGMDMSSTRLDPMAPMQTPEKLAADKRESEFNHHLAGFFVVLAGIFILAEPGLSTRWPNVRYAWPVCFLLAGIFVLIFSDTELWPFGAQSWSYGLSQHLEVRQHKSFALMGGIEFLRARGSVKAAWAGWVFPVVAIAGSLILIFHEHRGGSIGLSTHNFAAASDAQAPGHLSGSYSLRSLMPVKSEITRRHEVEFYSDDAGFVVGFAYFIEAALKAGNSVIVVATESHRENLLERLKDHGVDIVAATERGRYLPLDVDKTLSAFLGSDGPDPIRFFKVVGDLIAAGARATAGDQSRVSVCGECAPILWAEGKTDAAIQVEHLCNQVAKCYNIDILCGFSLNDFCRQEDKQIFQKICKGTE
jgi:hypothetical protein